MKQLKKIIAIIISLAIAFTIYVFYVNRNNVNMTTRQKILKATYPALMWFARLKEKKTKPQANEKAEPAISFYSLQFAGNGGNLFDFAQLKGKKILIVNTASDCGYTDQYADLQKLFELQKGKLTILAFPANDFKEQETAGDAEIAAFCKKNYAITFPLMQKSTVIKTTGQNPVYQWLTNPAANGWNSKAPSWNFSKYLIDEEGKLVNYFGPSVSPLSNEVAEAIATK